MRVQVRQSIKQVIAQNITQLSGKGLPADSRRFPKSSPEMCSITRY